MLTNRRLLIAIVGTLLFAIVIIVWYFFYAKPIVAPSLSETKNPLPRESTPAKFQFLTLWGTGVSQSSKTEVVDPLKNPLIQIWGKPATGQTFITRHPLKEFATTSMSISFDVATSSKEEKRLLRATSTSLLFVDKGTGYIYEYPLDTGVPFQVSNSIIPGVEDAYFFDDGKRVIMRYFDKEKGSIIGILANVPNVRDGSSPLSLTKMQYLTGQVTSIAVNQKKDKASYLVGTDSGSSIYTITPKGTVFVASSPFKEWALAYGGEALYLTTKPSAYVEGETVLAPSFQPEISEKTGLMSAPSSNGILLNSMWGRSGLITFLSSRGDVQVLSIKTLAPKCTFGGGVLFICAVPRIVDLPIEGLPDDWLQGGQSFVDDLYMIDMTTGEDAPLYGFSEKEGDFDIRNIVAHDNSTYISFTKKQDQTLWLLNTSIEKEQ